MTMTTGIALEFELHHYMARALEHADIGVAEIADELGVSRATVGRWINGRGKPSKATLIAWAQLTGVDYDWLCARRDSNPQPSDWESRDLSCDICGSRFHLAQECTTYDDQLLQGRLVRGAGSGSQNGHELPALLDPDDPLCFICHGEHDVDDCPRADELDDAIEHLRMPA